MNLQEHLASLSACREAKEWTGDRTATEVWQICERPDWLLWWAARTPQNTKADIVQVAILIAEDVLHLCSDRTKYKAQTAIQAAKDWVSNPTEENKQKARVAASNCWSADAADAAYAAYSAYAAYAAAADAAYAAAADTAYAAYAAYAVDAAYAAYAAAAAYAAYAVDAADAAYSAYAAAARQQKGLQYCEFFRKNLKQPWIEVV